MHETLGRMRRDVNRNLKVFFPIRTFTHSTQGELSVMCESGFAHSTHPFQRRTDCPTGRRISSSGALAFSPTNSTWTVSRITGNLGTRTHLSGYRVNQALGPVTNPKPHCEEISGASNSISSSKWRWIVVSLTSLTCLLGQPKINAKCWTPPLQSA